MKMKLECRVPLSWWADGVLRRIQALRGERLLKRPGPSDPVKSMSEDTFNSALARVGCQGSSTVHGFRAFS